ncbi:MAG: NMD3-related protein [Candidatus Woesearchaeota archaeon]|jgi:nonsense-mediated mRNA decay protein 3
MKFCPKCGKDTDELIHDLCPDCYFKSNDILDGFKPTNIQVCKVCKKIKIANWANRRDDNVVEKAVADNIKPKRGVIIKNVEVKYKFGTDETIKRENVKAKVKVTAEIDKHRVTFEYDMPISLSRTRCPLCEKINVGYFEGILQLRPITHTSFDDAVYFIRKDMDEQKKYGIAITEEVDQKEGLDFYFSKKIYLQTIAKKVVKKFGGEIDVNSRLITFNHQTSKDVTRLTVLIRLPKYGKNDIISTDDKLLLVDKIYGKTVYGLEIDSGKKTRVETNLKKPEIVVRAQDMEKDEDGNLIFEYNEKKYKINPNQKI